MKTVFVARTAGRAGLMAGVIALLAGPVAAQTPLLPAAVPAEVKPVQGVGEGGIVAEGTPVPPPPPVYYPGVATNALCGTCGSAGCGENGCVAGRGPCGTCCEGAGPIRRLFCGFQNAMMCPDPCYQGKWIPAANAALFVDPTRPVTMTRFRWDSGVNVTTPDRSDSFFGSGAFPGAPVPRSVNYNELRLYQEIAIDKFALFFDLPYRNLGTDNRGGSGGIGDLEFGFKTMFVDSELFLATFQFKTRVPTGNAATGVGTGSASLDPSLLTTVKLHQNTYWQSQTGYWFALGNGNGSMFHTHNSINTTLCQLASDTSLMGSLESGLYTFTSGNFRDPTTGLPSGVNGATYFTLGPGFRLAIGNNLDVGFGMQFALTSGHFAEQLYRTELRWRF